MTDTPTPEGVTPEQVAAILKDVTPGPWSFFQGEDDADRAYFGVTAPSGDVCMMSNAQIWRGKQTIANARFMEWARNNVEALAADRDAQKARADALEGNATEQHWDDHCVNQFAKMMREKMALSRAKGRSGWNDPNQCSVQYLRELLYEHLDKGDPVDVANICMMLRHYDASTARDYGNTLDMLKHRAEAAEARADAAEQERDALIAARDAMGSLWAQDYAHAEAAEAKVAKLVDAMNRIKALDDNAECCGQGECGGYSPPECCGQPLYGLDRAQNIARAVIAEVQTNRTTTPTEYERKVAQMKEDFPNGI